MNNKPSNKPDKEILPKDKKKGKPYTDKPKKDTKHLTKNKKDI